MAIARETTKYLLLNRRVGWHEANLDSVVIDGDTGQLRLQVLPCLDRPLSDASGDFGGLVLPVSIAEDREGRLYILDAQTLAIKRFDPCAQAFETLPLLGGPGSAPRQFLNPHHIAISARNDLYVADTGNRRVQIFELKGLSLRALWGPLLVTHDDSGIHVNSVAARPPDWHATGEFIYPPGTWQPWSIALSTSRNLVYISDYANGLIHVFDTWGQWHTAFTGATAEQPALEKPTYLTLDKDERLYVLQEDKDYVTVLDSNGAFLKKVERPEEVKGSFRPLSVAVDEVGNIYLCERVTRRLYYYCHTIDDSYAGPSTCRGFYCCGTALIFDKAGNPLLVDTEKQQVLRLNSTILYQSEGTYYSDALDSNIYRCQWHRVLLSAHIPPGTSVRVDTFTADVSRPIEEIKLLSEARWETGRVDSQVGCSDWDCLVRSQPGRFLWLRLRLTGESMATPAIEQIQVYFPRSSSLQYLPATYSEDPDSRDFLERFLSIFDTMRDKISHQITDIASYFDPGSTPASQSLEQDFLSWLASWIGMTVDRNWPEAQRRQLVKQAHRLYKLRGTPEGLRQHILLYLGTEPYILEHFKLRRWLFLDSARLGDQSALWGKGIMDRLQLDEHAQIGSFQLLDTGDPVSDPFYRYAHQFTIIIPMRAPCSPTQQQTLQRIIEMAKPAHTQGFLQVVQPRFRIGIESIVGIDTLLGRYPEQTITGESKLGYESVLAASLHDKPPTMRIGKRSRIGSSTLLD